MQGQDQKAGAAARRRVRAGETAARGRAEFREMFVSLVDPAGLLDMDRCAAIAARMGEAASWSEYRAGARMASLLADIFADMADIVYRPVDDGALYYTTVASRNMKALLHDTAVSYREGGDGEPVAGLEKLRKDVAALKSGADTNRARLRAADPPGSRLSRFDSLYKGKVCRDVIREDIEKIRARREAEGLDPIFPPEPKFPAELSELLGGQRVSSVEMLEEARYGKFLDV